MKLSGLLFAASAALSAFTVYANPDTPETPSALRIECDSLVLGWSPAAGANGYLMYIEDSQNNQVFYDNIGNTTEYTAAGLQPLTTYHICIRAYNDNNSSVTYSKWSGWMIATTSAPEAPVLAAIPVQQAQAGRPFRLDLAQYISSKPVPKFEIIQGSASIDGSVFCFTPKGCGQYGFTVMATNDTGVTVAEFSVSAETFSPKRFALCVGIDEYAEITSLQGCVNDARFMAANLIERGEWEETDVVVLTNAQATKSAIRKTLSNFAAIAMPGDTFLYMHSSHGGQTNAGNENDPLTGEDGKATYLCVYDEHYGDNSTAYNDYELAEDLAKFKSGVKAAVIVDACFSAGMFKSTAKGVTSVKTFNLAERVSSILESGRTRQTSLAKSAGDATISAEEIGWAVAAEYYEYSQVGGFYHTGEWIENNHYGEEYFYNGQFPEDYRVGGLFLASGTWGWWSGSADADSAADYNNGICDAYEFWKKGYDFCSKAGEFRYGTSQLNYYPQCTNITALQAVELGWSASPETLPALPAGASSERIFSLLANAADKNLISHLTDPAEYNVFRNWVQLLGSSSKSNASTVKDVLDSSQAWISFALGANSLITDSLKDGCLHIVSFNQDKTTGRFLIEAHIDGVAIGSSPAVPEKTLLANLTEVISAEGATKPSPANFKSTSVNASMETPVDGKARINLAPKETSGNSYFFRVKIND